MKQLIPFARKRRQWLRAWSAAYRTTGAERVRFLRKLRRLAHTFRAAFTVPQWARVTAALAALALAPNAAEAQVFAAPNNAAFGLNTLSANTVVLPSFVDMDNDGDLDLMACDLYGSGVYFVPNTGTAAVPAFGLPQPSPFGLSDTTMFYSGFSDLDNDGDIDVLAYKFDYYATDNGFHYYQNTGSATAPAFGTPAYNPFGLNGASPATLLSIGRFADMDNDGDDDYLAMNFYTTGFRYYQNTGTATAPQFAAPVINPFGLTTPKGEMRSMSSLLDGAVFPGIQGGPLEHVIGAKAVAFGEALTDEYFNYILQVKKNALALANALQSFGYHIVSGGTDNHLMLIDLRNKDISGKEAEAALGQVHITANKNMVPYDDKSPFVTSGIRLGTPAVTTRGLVEADMVSVAGWINEALVQRSNESHLKTIAHQIETLMADRPLFVG